jgi:uncharacterized membrane protein YfcA
MLKDLILLLVGIIVGGMNSIAGGGMLIGFPVLLAAGLSPLTANVTSNIILIPGQLSSAFGYRKYVRKIPKMYLLLLIPTIIGSACGAVILRHTSSNSFERFIPELVLFAVVLFVFQPFLHQHIHRHLHGPAKHRQQLQPLIFVGIAMLPLSIYGGYFGAGFGFVMLALLGFTKLHDIHQMNGLKNIMGVCIATVSIIVLYSSGHVDWQHGISMGTGNFIGGYVGAVSTQKISSHVIRIIVIVIGIGTVTYLGLRTY